MTRKPTPRAVLYVRLSSSDDASTSIARQEADLRLRAEREGWDVVRVLADDGVSGGKARANADEALRMLRDGEADVLAVWKFDRWSRQGLGALAALIEVLDERPSALFIADRDGLASSQPAWRIIASVLAEVARMERENTRTRVLSSLAALRTSGRYAGGQRPYGYVSAPNPDGPGRVLVIEPTEAEVIREAARRVLDGETVYAVAHDLNAREIPSKSGKRWSRTVLLGVLTSDAILGRVTHRGEVVRGEDGLPAEIFEPILDGDSWHRLRALLVPAKGEEVRPQRRRAARLLSGVIRCAACGSPLYVRSDGKGIVSYVCSRKGDGGVCPGVSVNAERVEEYVERVFLEAVGDAEVFTLTETESASAADLADVERAVAETTAALGEDDADVASLMARLASLKERRAALRSAASSPEVALVGTGSTFRETWEAGDVEARRALLSANVAVLTVSKGRRGVHGLDASRVTLVAQPAHPRGIAPDAEGGSRIVA
ncbi:recombinase family protein [Knoellia koreensis]|uniref:Recombinase family protein n=1 Tax=Knoellia koreensis TaxID=2730921 RepID=A0A849H409_9MICO|nr:recombinase family protein [Knoellia sp. DB2414S]NNM44530.1 recombinase family protein [Knoellia sp. DB2414S]